MHDTYTKNEQDRSPKLSSKLSLILSAKLCQLSVNDRGRRNSWFKQVFEDDGLESLLTLSLTFSFNSSGLPTYAAKTVLVHLSKKCLVDEIKGIILTQCVKNKIPTLEFEEKIKI